MEKSVEPPAATKAEPREGSLVKGVRTVTSRRGSATNPRAERPEPPLFAVVRASASIEALQRLSKTLNARPRVLVQRAQIAQFGAGSQAADGFATTDEDGAKKPALPEPRPADREIVQRKLTFQGKEITDAAGFVGDFADLAGTTETIQQLIDLPEPAYTSLRLDQLLAVHKYRTGQIKDIAGPAAVAVAHMKYGRRFDSTQAVGFLANPHAFQNYLLLKAFLDANPNVRKNLKEQGFNAAGVGFQFFSSDVYAGALGGAGLMARDDNIHFQPVAMGLESEYFRRTAVHEIGHATFQRLLTVKERWAPYDKGEHDPPDEALKEDGREFFEAWKVLRTSPEYFFVADVVPGAPEGTKSTGRANYLARKFSEFCADSFMNFALMRNELLEHVRVIWAGDAPDSIKEAWRSALKVLQKNETKILGAVPLDATSAAEPTPPSSAAAAAVMPSAAAAAVMPGSAPPVMPAAPAAVVPAVTPVGPPSAAGAAPALPAATPVMPNTTGRGGLLKGVKNLLRRATARGRRSVGDAEQIP